MESHSADLKKLADDISEFIKKYKNVDDVFTAPNGIFCLADFLAIIENNYGVQFKFQITGLEDE